MKQMFRMLVCLLVYMQICLYSGSLYAASPAAVIQNMRFSQSAEKVRIVFELDNLPEYSVQLANDNQKGTDVASHILVTMPDTVNKSQLPSLPQNDPVFKSLRFTSTEGKLTAAIDLKTAAVYKVFTLKGPNRLVVDIIKEYDQKIQKQIAPGLLYTSILRGRAAGPVSAHVLDIDPRGGLELRPLLSNEKVAGLEKLSAMSSRSGALAAVNAPYFALDGTILGVTKIDNTIVSSLAIPRTAFGIFPDGKLLIGEVQYQGKLELPDGQTLPIAGVNCERGSDALVLYNEYYDATTNTNPFGTEYIVEGNTVTSINTSDNSTIPKGGVVLSAHGAAAQALAKLAVGDTVKITQTLGTQWDQAIHVIGAGPRLIKDNSISITSKMEEFESDVTTGRAPRTAIGITKNGHILLAVVDGRQKHSIGFSLLELSAFMQEMGAVQAMNFDGGGSSEMIVRGEVLNKPSDGRERSIGAGLGIISR